MVPYNHIRKDMKPLILAEGTSLQDLPVTTNTLPTELLQHISSLKFLAALPSQP